jgi:TPR repeat protein
MREPPWKRKSASSGFEGDVAIVELRARLALAPDHIPEPVSRRSHGSAWGVASRLAGIATLAAGGTLALLWLYAPQGEGPLRSFGSVRQPASPDLQVAAISVKNDLVQAPQSVPQPWVGDLVSWPDAGNGRLRASTNAVLPTAAPVEIDSPGTSEVRDAGLEPAETRRPQQAPVPPAPVGPTQNRDEIAALVARGAKYFAAGDVAAARLVLRPAAVAGDSGAALALGETYDPLMLKRLGVIGFAGDLAEARDWYRRAAELGSADAPQRLDQLAGLDR